MPAISNSLVLIDLLRVVIYFLEDKSETAWNTNASIRNWLSHMQGGCGSNAVMENRLTCSWNMFGYNSSQ